MLARFLAAAMCLLLTSCAWTPVAMYGHVSDPSVGPPSDSDCEDVSDFAGFGAGQAWGQTRLYIVGGVKRFRVCVDELRPADVRHEPGGQLIVVRELKKGGR